MDQIRLLFIITVSLITFSVFLFRYDYIKREKFYVGFHVLIIAFVARIIILILRPNLLRAILGWDGLGLSSYLLVIFYRNGKAFYSGMITALTNRLGDIFMLLSIGMLSVIGSWRMKFYREILLDEMFWGAFLVILARCTKRAQIPFCA